MHSSPREHTVRFTPEVLAQLQKHRWSGTVLELRNVVSRALLLRKGAMLDESDIIFEEAPEDVPSRLLKK
jgi:DNA-binding NtrC family response regulator